MGVIVLWTAEGISPSRCIARSSGNVIDIGTLLSFGWSLGALAYDVYGGVRV